MYWEIYAFVSDGIIRNVAVFDPHGAYTHANEMAQSIYGVDAFAINVTDYPVQEGDTCTDGGEFFRNGEKIKKVNTIQDDLTDLQVAMAELAEIVAG